jgi:hypothetical protein
MKVLGISMARRYYRKESSVRRTAKRIRRMLPLVLIIALAATLAPATALARSPFPGGLPGITSQATTIYDSTVTPMPDNLPSIGFQATQTGQFGDEITFDGTARTLQQVAVTLSSWGCQTGGWPTSDCVTTPGATFSVPITFTIYSVGANDAVGAVLATATQTFNVPYRPSADTTNCSSGKWYDSQTGKCSNGIATNITFDFSSQSVALPASVIYGISYNTTSYGLNPIGTSAACFSTPSGCPYDSLNVALSPAVVVGSKPHADTVFQDSATAGNYCDSASSPVTGVFRLDSPTSACWTGYVPAVQFTASTIPTSGPAAWIYNFQRLFNRFQH